LVVRPSRCFEASCSISHARIDPADAFAALDLRLGRIIRAEANERAHKPSYKLWIDFGPLGEKTSNAQLRAIYRAEDLVGRLIVAAVNLGTRNIAGFLSEVLVLGVPDDAGDVVLLSVERDAPLGARVF
jgi:tRNA-binding protein